MNKDDFTPHYDGQPPEFTEILIMDVIDLDKAENEAAFLMCANHIHPQWYYKRGLIMMVDTLHGDKLVPVKTLQSFDPDTPREEPEFVVKTGDIYILGKVDDPDLPEPKDEHDLVKVCFYVQDMTDLSREHALSIGKLMIQGLAQLGNVGPFKQDDIPMVIDALNTIQPGVRSELEETWIKWFPQN